MNTWAEEQAETRRRSGIDGPGTDGSLREREQIAVLLAEVWDAMANSATELSAAAMSISNWLDSVMARLPVRYESDYESVALVGLWTEHYDRLHAYVTGRNAA